MLQPWITFLDARNSILWESVDYNSVWRTGKTRSHHQESLFPKANGLKMSFLHWTLTLWLKEMDVDFTDPKMGCQRPLLGDVPDGPVAKTPNAGGPGSIPGQEARSHGLQLWVRKPELKSPRAATKTLCSQINIFKKKRKKEKDLCLRTATSGYGYWFSFHFFFPLMHAVPIIVSCFCLFKTYWDKNCIPWNAQTWNMCFDILLIPWISPDGVYAHG